MLLFYRFLIWKPSIRNLHVEDQNKGACTTKDKILKELFRNCHDCKQLSTGVGGKVQKFAKRGQNKEIYVLNFDLGSLKNTCLLLLNIDDDDDDDDDDIGLYLSRSRMR